MDALEGGREGGREREREGGGEREGGREGEREKREGMGYFCAHLYVPIDDPP